MQAFVIGVAGSVPKMQESVESVAVLLAIQQQPVIGVAGSVPKMQGSVESVAVLLAIQQQPAPLESVPLAKMPASVARTLETAACLVVELVVMLPLPLARLA